jgi:diguanylate cyclase (GGDEF)-like protein/PAS domain S-box-containing protein
MYMTKTPFFLTARMDSKLAVVFILIGLLSLIVAGSLALVYANRILSQQVISKLQVVADSKAQRIEGYLLSRVVDVTVHSRSPSVLSHMELLSAVFHQQGIHSPEYAAAIMDARAYFTRYVQPNNYDNVLLIDAGGDIVFSVVPTAESGANLHTAPYKDTALAKAFENVGMLLATEISDYEMDAASGEQKAFIAAPIFKNGVLAGALVLRVNNRELFEIARDYTGLGDTGETLVGRREGDTILVMVPTRHDPVAAFHRRITIGSRDGVTLQNATHGNDGIGQVRDYRGVEVLAAWKYLPALRGGLVVKMDITEAFAPVRTLSKAFITLGILVTLLVALLAPLFSRYLSAPIRKLSEAARAFSGGDLTHRAHIDSNDELGNLALAFNQMAETIQQQITTLSQSHNELELRVEKRTADLAKANLALQTEVVEHQRAEESLRDSEEYFRFLNDLAEATRTLADPEQIMAVMSRKLGEYLHASRCAYADVAKDGEQFTILHDYTDGCVSTVGNYHLSLFGTRAVAMLHSGQTLIIRNVEAELLPGEGADMFNAIDIKAIITYPLVKNGVLRAMMAVHQTTPRDWKPSEVAIVQEVVERYWATIERRTAEENLRKSEALLLIAGRTARLGGWAVNLPEVSITWSDEVCAIHDVPPGTVPGLEQAFGFYAPQSRETVSKAFEACAQQGTPFDLELEVITAKGRRVWVRSIGQAQRNAAGAITRVQGAFQDITERKQADAMLRADQEKFSSMFEMSPLGMLRNSMDGYYTEANQAFLNMVGYSLEELNNLSYWDITPKEYTGQEDEQLNSLMTTGKYGPYEKEYFHKDGHRIPIRLNGVLLTDKDGIKSIWSIIEDVTESRLHAESMQLAAMVYQHTSEAIMVTDAKGVITNINPAFTQITGYTKEEVTNSSSTTFSSSDPEKAANKAMLHALETVGHWQGEMIEQRKNGDAYVEWLTTNTIYNEDNSVHHRVSIFSDITQKKASEDLILQQANFDSLTGLPNRRLFRDRLDQATKRAKRSNLKLALIFIDLDHFKEINDTLGHDVGDILLKEAALRLAGSIRDTDTVARQGGDEFTIILSELHDTDSVERVVQALLYKMSQPFHLNNETAYISASIGIAFFPEDATDANDLLKSADQAMYTAKNQGRNRSSYFTPSMQESAKARMLIANDLHTALAGNQFRVYYQPIVELSSGSTHKAEALIRWIHPSRGFVSPAEFIPIAEETGLIVEIGNWVFREAVKQTAKLRAAYDPEFQVSVNKSPLQFRSEINPHIDWIEYLSELGLPGKSLVIEITEGLLMDTSSSIYKKLLAFRDAGVELSLDDFGTGYSSLSYLKKFDIDYLKIDRSFVSNLSENSDDLALCEAMIVMAHKLGIKVIAEGIETAEQRDILLNVDCDYGQGYLFSKPVPIEEFVRFVS